MKTKRSLLLVLCVIPFLLFFSPEEESHASPVMGYLGKVFNFLILFGGLIFLLRKPLRNLLTQRALDIQAAIQGAEEERLGIEKKLKKIQTRLHKLEKEIEEIKKDAEEEGRKKREEIVTAAQRDAERMKQFARQEIDLFQKSKFRELRRRTAELATTLARAKIEKKMTPDRQVFLIDESISRLEDLYEKQNSR